MRNAESISVGDRFFLESLHGFRVGVDMLDCGVDEPVYVVPVPEILYVPVPFRHAFRIGVRAGQELVSADLTPSSTKRFSAGRRSSGQPTQSEKNGSLDARIRVNCPG